MGLTPATVPVPVPGSQISAVTYGAPVANDINGGVVTPPFCELQSVAGTAIGASAFTKITGFALIEDTEGMADLTNNQIIIRTAGRYDLRAQLCWAVSGTGSRGVFIRINGVTYKCSSTGVGSAADTLRQQVTRQVRLAVGDAVELVGWTSAAVSLDPNATYGAHLLSASYVAP